MRKIILFVLVLILAVSVCYLIVGLNNKPVYDVTPSGDLITVAPSAEKNELDPDKFYSENGRTYYDDESVTYGIDVSSHQGDIDWAQVKADGIDFAIIRAGYRGYGKSGKLNEDEYLVKNLKGAKENGIKVGVYFFSQAITEAEAREEAEFVLGLVSGQTLDYPIFFDWEYITYDDSSRTHDYESLDISSFANAFASVVKEAGYVSCVYFNPSYGYNLYDIEKISQNSFWLAEYKDKPEFYYGFSVWQYSNEGKVSGIAGKVDMDISFTDFFGAE